MKIPIKRSTLALSSLYRRRLCVEWLEIYVILHHNTSYRVHDWFLTTSLRQKCPTVDLNARKKGQSSLWIWNGLLNRTCIDLHSHVPPSPPWNSLAPRLDDRSVQQSRIGMGDIESHLHWSRMNRKRIRKIWTIKIIFNEIQCLLKQNSYPSNRRRDYPPVQDDK